MSQQNCPCRSSWNRPCWGCTGGWTGCTGWTGPTGCTGAGIAVIGNTVAATLYTQRLLNHHKKNITVIIEGRDYTSLNQLSDTDFNRHVSDHPTHFIYQESVHLVNDPFSPSDSTITYSVGKTVLGDLVSDYFIPRVGPWFNHDTSTRVVNFVNTSTVKMALNYQECTVAKSIVSIYGLPWTSSVRIGQPAMLNCHYVYVQANDDGNATTTFTPDSCQWTDNYIRQLYWDEYSDQTPAEGVKYAHEVTGIKFTPGSVTGTYNVTGNGLSQLSNVKVVFETNPYSYLRVAGFGGLLSTQKSKSLSMPAFYRAVISIPLNNTAAGGVDLTGLQDLGDLVTTHLAFSTHDLSSASTNQSILAWLFQCYTTTIDYSAINKNNSKNYTAVYAPTGSILLVIEGLSVKNQRSLSYLSNEELQLKYNSSTSEQGYLNQFKDVVSKVYTAYTGVAPPNLDQTQPVCSPNAPCQDYNFIATYPQRESPMLSVIQLVSCLYGMDGFPSLPKY